ncbi:MAG: acyl-CoA dehydrogenase family protein [Candidatus Bathyarchaeota archaeon]|nr:acyl-CoA dehydrogenase family protein [Candidatus Bathyarchaeota archaeon]
MDFGLTEKQLNLKNSVRKFCEKEFNPDYALELDKKEEFPMKLYQKAAKQGFPSLFIPEKYGGGGQGYLAACLAMEEMCRADSSLGLACMIGTFGSELIILNGTEEQKNRYLPPLCRGDSISAAAFTEPKSGTDITTVDTTATKHGDEWRINGTKTLITNAPIADFIIVLCQTGSRDKPRKSQTLFIVDKEAPGLTVTKLSNKMGIRCVTTGEVSLKNVKVSDNNILGELNNGFSHSMNFFTLSRTLIAAQAVGTAQGAFEIALKHAKQRQSHGQPIIRFQQIGAKLAQVASEIEAARLLTYKAACTIDQNNVDPMLTSMAKLYSSNVAVKAADAAIQTLGGYGYLGEYRVERFYRDARVTEIYEGTSEIQRLAILKQLIKSS